MEEYMKKDIGNPGMRPMQDRVRGCRHCLTSSGIKKMRDVVTKVKKHFINLWIKRSKSK